MPQSYFYSSVAGQFTLTIAATGGATILNVDTTTGMPGGLPFKLILEPGTVREEIVKVTSIGGLALTVVRGWDGSPAMAHDAGSVVRHGVTSEDLTLSRAHEAAVTGVHGVTSGLVGVSDTQTITNKTISPNTSSAVAAVVKGLSGQTGDLIQFQDNLGNALAKVDSAGNVTAPNLTTLGNTVLSHGSSIAANTSSINANTSAITALQNSKFKVCTSGTRPGSPATGDTIFETDTTAFGIWDGSTWLMWDTRPQLYTPTFTASGGTPAAGNSQVFGRYFRYGKRIQVTVRYSFGSTSNGGNTDSTFSLPIGGANVTSMPLLRGIANLAVLGANGFFVGGVRLSSASTFQVYMPNSQSDGRTNVMRSANNTDAAGTGIPAVSGAYSLGINSEVTADFDYELA